MTNLAATTGTSFMNDATGMHPKNDPVPFNQNMLCTSNIYKTQMLTPTQPHISNVSSGYCGACLHFEQDQ